MPRGDSDLAPGVDRGPGATAAFPLHRRDPRGDRRGYFSRTSSYAFRQRDAARVATGPIVVSRAIADAGRQLAHIAAEVAMLEDRGLELQQPLEGLAPAARKRLRFFRSCPLSTP